MDNFNENAQNVITMSDNQSDTGYAAIAQVEAYWEALRGDRLMPNRSEIDPRGIENALENAFIIERIAPGIARLRIAGSHLSNLMGMEVRGMPITSMFTSSARRRFSDTLEEILETPATCMLHLESDAAAGQAKLEGQMILLPLKSDMGDISRVLGCLVSSGPLGHTPCRFTVTHLTVRPILPGHGPTDSLKRGSRKLPSLQEMDLPKIPEPGGFAAPKTSFETSKGKRRPPYLRLIKSDD